MYINFQVSSSLRLGMLHGVPGAAPASITRGRKSICKMSNSVDFARHDNPKIFRKWFSFLSCPTPRCTTRSLRTQRLGKLGGFHSSTQNSRRAAWRLIQLHSAATNHLFSIPRKLSKQKGCIVKQVNLNPNASVCAVDHSGM